MYDPVTDNTVKNPARRADSACIILKCFRFHTRFSEQMAKILSGITVSIVGSYCFYTLFTYVSSIVRCVRDFWVYFPAWNVRLETRYDNIMWIQVRYALYGTAIRQPIILLDHPVRPYLDVNAFSKPKRPHIRDNAFSMQLIL